MTATAYLLLSLAIGAFAAVYRRTRRSSNLPYPPGPPGLPILGNLFDPPKEHAWLTYQRWSKEYESDIIRLNLLGSTVIIVNSHAAAMDLLEKRGTIYSERPVFTMLAELCGFGWNITLLKYGARWRSGRRAFQRELGPQSVKQYRPMIERGTHRLLQSILAKPEDLLNHYRLMAGAHILGIAYGLDIRDANDPYITDAKISVECFSECTFPGSFLVDTFPFMRHIPEWVPGARFQRQAREWKKPILEVRDRPFDTVKTRMEHGDAPDCAAKALLNAMESKADSSFTEDDIKAALGTMYAAGADTTMSALGFLSLALVRDPSIQVKAHRMIDEVCPGRLPTLDDQPDLPYVDGLVKEALRWHPVLPLGLPHQIDEDDIYNGYFIPKGTQVFMNSWAVLHDEEIYSEPHRFNPDRWLKDGKLDTTIRDPDAAFGGGRRICPGRFMAYEAMWLTVACLLAVFDFAKAKDERGDPIMPEDEILSGMLWYVKPFQFDIRPRSKEHEALVRATAEAV